MLVKLCGIKSAAVLRKVQECGADIAGFVFAASRRRVTIEQAAAIAAGVSIRKAGVFVNAAPEEVAAAVQACRLDYVQLHGDESAEYAAAVKNSLQVGIIKAYRYDEHFDAAAVNAYPADLVIIDSGSGGAYGGTGLPFDWQKAAASLRRVQKPLLIAGGINQANVSRVMELLPAAGVDVSSGVEEQGEKSTALIESFMKYVRDYERRNMKC